MNTDTGLFEHYTDPPSRGIQVQIDNGTLIPFTIGQEFALNGYWFRVKSASGKDIILEGVRPTNGHIKEYEGRKASEIAQQTRKEQLEKFKRELYGK